MWYSVEALFRCSVENEIKNVLYEKTVFLIEVKEDEAISKKAKQMARKFENAYKNDLNRKVSWNLVKVLQIQNLVEKKLYDGIEVFSHLMWERDVPKNLRKSSIFSRKNKKRKVTNSEISSPISKKYK